MEKGTSPNKILFDIEKEVPNNLNHIKLSQQTKELLSKGSYSDFLEGMLFDDGTVKSGKVKLSRDINGEIEILYHFKKEKLVIPEKLGEYKLTENDKIRLGENKLSGPIPYKGNNIYLQVDPELNSIIVKMESELSMGEIIEAKFDKFGEFSIGSNKLTTDMVQDLIKGKELPNMVYFDKETNQHFLAIISITPDGKGIKFFDYITISKEKALELMPILNKHEQALSPAIHVAKEAMQDKNQLLDQTKIQEAAKPQRNLQQEFQDALAKRDFLKMQKLSNQGFKPSQHHIQTINSMDALSTEEISQIQHIFQLEVKSDKIIHAESLANTATELSNTTLLTNSRETSLIPERKDGFLEPGNHKDPDYLLMEKYQKALEEKDFVKLNEMAQSGFKPDAATMEKTLLSNNLNAEEKIAIQTIFDAKPDREVGQSHTKSTEEKGGLLQQKQAKNQSEKEGQKTLPGNKTKSAMNIMERGFSNM